jgi:glycosyltransferase involved in cell wall biosynthesis
MSAVAPISLHDPESTLPESANAARGSRAPVGLSVVIPTFNEGHQIGAAVQDLRWADEVIVVDGGSTDRTAEIAESLGARVLVVRGETIAAQRNAGIAEAANQWVLALDADERVSAALRDAIAEVVRVAPSDDGAVATHAAYRIRFENHYLGRELRHGPWGRDWHIRLFTRDRRYRCNRVHERLESIEDVGVLPGVIVHRPYRDLAHHVAKIVKYARWGADDLHARGRRANLWTLCVRPAWRFFRDFVLLSGWRDGVEGLIASALGAFAAFLKYAFLLTRSRQRAA